MPDLLEPAKHQMLRASSYGRPVAVDRKANALRGYVVAQAGRFKDDRGEFDLIALELVEKLGNESKAGLKSRFSHPSVSDDGLGKHLGRSRDFFLSEATTEAGVKVQAVRADLFFDATAMQEPVGGGKPLGTYVMDLAESDPEAISSSLVLKTAKLFRRKADGTLETDAKGQDLPPLWRPEKLYASDIVDDGAAVDGLLSNENLPSEALLKGAALVDGLFLNLSRDEVAERLRSWLDKYLDHRFGEIEVPVELAPALAAALLPDGMLEVRKRRLRANSRPVLV